MNSKRKTKILITGGAGFIGSHITSRYLSLGYDVVVVDNLVSGCRSAIPPKVGFYQADITSQKDIEKIFSTEKPDVVNHLAAISTIETRKTAKKENYKKTNVLGSSIVIEQALKQRVKKFIFASSAAVYGDASAFPTYENAKISPLSVYGKTKAETEKELEKINHRIQVVIFRYSNVYGNGNSKGVLFELSNAIRNNNPFILNAGGRQTRDFIHIDDVVDANTKVLNTQVSGVFNISSGAESTIIELIDIFNKKFSTSLSIQNASPTENEIKRSCLSNEKARKILGWFPSINLEQGLAKLTL